ncbi:hypothetical protein NQ317_004323 [Molorchus minor]|uniref:Uncharacterized protein n=1 Tax=Molorchus minor TaxID=1323400 RepID=A0ABQ9JX31_9CUCU|nr:hypothetical protein NQ317_004323 [Molorchus minor]
MRRAMWHGHVADADMRQKTARGVVHVNFQGGIVFNPDHKTIMDHVYDDPPLNEETLFVDEILESINTTDIYPTSLFDNAVFLIGAYIAEAIVCLITDVLLTFIILRYKNIRQDRVNIIILNIIVLDFLLVIASVIPTMFVETETYFSRILPELFVVLHLPSIVMCAFLTNYWYMKLYFSNRLLKLNNHFKILICGIYVLAGFCIGVYYFTEVLFVLPFFMYIVFMVVVDIAHAVNMSKIDDYKLKDDCIFFLVNAFCVLKTPVLTVIALRYTNILQDAFISEIVLYLSILFAALNSIGFLIILYLNDRRYKLALQEAFRCRCKRDNAEDEYQYVGFVHEISDRPNVL